MGERITDGEFAAAADARGWQVWREWVPEWTDEEDGTVYEARWQHIVVKFDGSFVQNLDVADPSLASPHTWEVLFDLGDQALEHTKMTHRAHELGFNPDKTCACDNPDPVLASGDGIHLAGWWCARCRGVASKPRAS